MVAEGDTDGDADGDVDGEADGEADLAGDGLTLDFTVGDLVTLAVGDGEVVGVDFLEKLV
ncbi:MAG: hypothetical protein US94_C0001G0024 [Berkelbacteria bacterium GW2011_GWB1_38_5]|uniref:Uncharacterized protein n=2 Tax=Candidatus Berkelbacteria TaxID=1618330 RepID=A0A0G0LGE3_9BACT|nr:MAG: hypothetical protein US94_C0001G0024 [Berkelbacteria bacterium GW2011_GWB1_38_5]KKQ90958.1 MAG: hypothetical protein UT15_C0002G0031 [Berkelbacteria bacterium GW2011_GWA1_39_10]